MLKDQLARAGAQGLTVKTGAEIEFFLFDESYEAARAKGYSGLTPSSTTIQDYHILQTTKDEPIIGAIRRGMAGAGLVVECSKGEAGYGQHEVNFRYADALRMADDLTIYKNGAKEIAALAGRSVTFMAKWTMADVGSSCHIHASIWDPTGTQSLSGDDQRASHMSERFEHFLAGLLATHQDLVLTLAPTVNSYKRFQLGSWAPTAVVWGRDNRTCGLRAVGHGSGTRIETRVPGADANPYVAMAGVIAGGLHGIEAELPLAAAFEGNAYEASGIPRIPWNIVEAIERWRGSAVAAHAFGPEVHHHLLNAAEQEWLQFNKTVTDWEVRRNFERH
jgi:glutamine synthetase